MGNVPLCLYATKYQKRLEGPKKEDRANLNRKVYSSKLEHGHNTKF